MAAALTEDQCYGLSCGSLNNGANVSVFHVKLTDSAARAFDSYQGGKGLSVQPSIRFTGNQGRIVIPRSESESAGETGTFTFYLTNVGRDNPQSSFDLLHQRCAEGVEAGLSCVGVIQQKMTVNATDDSYQKARQSLAQADEDTKSRAAIVIKPGGRFPGRRVKVRPPAVCLTDAAAASRHSSRPVLVTGRKGGPRGAAAAACGGPGERAAASRPLRERLTHLLALRPYRRAELLLTLQKDGLTGRDRDTLDTLLLQVGQLSSRDSTYTLKNSLYKELQRDWAGYTTGDQQLLKRILVRRLFQPQNLLSVPETQVSPLRDTPNSSPAQRYPVEEYTDPLANKKPRISHLSSKPVDGRRGPSPSGRREADHAPWGAAATEDGDCGVPSSDPRPPSAPSSEADTRNGQTPSAGAGSGAAGAAAAHPPTRLRLAHPTPQKLLDGGRRSRDRRRSKHRQRGEGLAGADGGEGNVHSLKHRERNGDTSVLPVANDRTDYLLKYTEIRGREQRLGYKQDFNVEYQEYLGLHARIDGVTRQFTQLDAQLKQLRHGSHRYQKIHNQILQEYRKIKKSNPNYRQDKTRCEYLHNKLAHIKRLISQYDQQQLRN